MVWSPRPLSKSRVRELAMAAGFGHSVDLAPAPAGSKRAAYYVSKYVTKATDTRADVPWWGEEVDHETGEVTEGLVDGRYRTWSMSRRWGLTMAAVRAEARAVVALREAELLGAASFAVVGAFPGASFLADESPPLSSA